MVRSLEFILNLLKIYCRIFLAEQAMNYSHFKMTVMDGLLRFDLMAGKYRISREAPQRFQQQGNYPKADCV